MRPRNDGATYAPIGGSFGPAIDAQLLERTGAWMAINPTQDSHHVSAPHTNHGAVKDNESSAQSSTYQSSLPSLSYTASPTLTGSRTPPPTWNVRQAFAEHGLDLNIDEWSSNQPSQLSALARPCEPRDQAMRSSRNFWSITPDPESFLPRPYRPSTNSPFSDFSPECGSVRTAFNADAETLFVCPHVDCGKRFTKRSDLEHHRRYHTEKRHACTRCNLKFHFNKDLKRHMKSHNPHERGLMCPILDCPYNTKGFQRNDHLQRHMRKVHGISETNDGGQSGKNTANTSKSADRGPERRDSLPEQAVSHSAAVIDAPQAVENDEMQEPLHEIQSSLSNRHEITATSAQSRILEVHTDMEDAGQSYDVPQNLAISQTAPSHPVPVFDQDRLPRDDAGTSIIESRAGPLVAEESIRVAEDKFPAASEWPRYPQQDLNATDLRRLLHDLRNMETKTRVLGELIRSAGSEHHQSSAPPPVGSLRAAAPAGSIPAVSMQNCNDGAATAHNVNQEAIGQARQIVELVPSLQARLSLLERPGRAIQVPRSIHEASANADLRMVIANVWAALLRTGSTDAVMGSDLTLLIQKHTPEILIHSPAIVPTSVVRQWDCLTDAGYVSNPPDSPPATRLPP